MSGGQAAKLVRNAALACAVLAAPAQAKNLNAGYVLNEMTGDQRVSYVEGIVDGLAYARFLRDRPDDTGYLCIVGWYQNDSAEKWKLVRKWLSRHPDKPVPLLMYLMIKKECGE